MSGQIIHNLDVPSMDLSSLDNLLMPEKQEEINPNEDRYIINSRTIDKHTVKRTRVKVTPVVCTTCGFDVAKLAFDQNKLSTPIYEELSPEIQSILRQTLEKHKQIAHTVADNLIISETELKKTKRWLSGRER